MIDNNEFKFKGKIILNMDMVCETGLHIGGTTEGYEIGGLDNPVIKTPVEIKISNDYIIPEDCPYIPGSSLKGKLRFLMEWVERKVVIKKEVANEIETYSAPQHDCGKKDCPICCIFGCSAKETSDSGPTRLYVMDAFPTKETIDNWAKFMGEGIYTELKSENTIDRFTSQANPRNMERIPAGSIFNTKFIYDVYLLNDINNLKKLFSVIKLLEDSTLGGSGSRGSGKVAFQQISAYWRSREYYLNQEEEKKLNISTRNNIEEIIKDFDSIFTNIIK